MGAIRRTSPRTIKPTLTSAVQDLELERVELHVVDARAGIVKPYAIVFVVGEREVGVTKATVARRF